MPRTFVAPLLGVLLAIAGCKKATDLAPDREQALALVAQYAPQLQAQRGKIDALSTRLAALPPAQPGADAVTAALARDRTAIAALQAVIDQVPGKSADAAKRGRRAELEALIDDTAEQVSGGLTQVVNDVADADLAVADLEAKAAPALDGGTPDAGSPAPDAR